MVDKKAIAAFRARALNPEHPVLRGSAENGDIYKHGAVADNRSIFDVSIRMMMYTTNSFQSDWAFDIDTPMTRAKADTIKNREQEKADARAAMGAYIGAPVVRFDPAANTIGDLVEGDFVWDFEGTPTPPWKSGTLRVAYTTAGFDTYFGEVE